ncbi:hypothetical protein PGTUg99_015725 [Puccinia graminis f. sp. tritici]|uniref:Uncharacterized protein n=1 Tax=Puccinia graminis f. sp. tritici TaxID=56615 RepID=A0A5B0QHK1_PUCGR|nr:hypothetical protein PGTUg99_015725 [Puccinia graminis f. sp. tritici]
MNSADNAAMSSGQQALQHSTAISISIFITSILSYVPSLTKDNDKLTLYIPTVFAWFSSLLLPVWS